MSRTKPTAIITSARYQDHQTGRHPENKTRAAALHDLAVKLVDAEPGRFTALDPVEIDPARLEAVHSSRYVAALERFCRAGGGKIDLNTTVSPASYDVALLAAGGLLRGVDAVMAGEADSAFALVRPPGHHAIATGSEGFCLFNNVAVAAKHLLDHYGLERVLIVDWDVHHGNGTQDMFYNDPRVLFFSSHQSPLYPGSGRLTETGEGKGRGYNWNLPLPAGCGDEVLARVFDMLLEPAVEKFQPQFVLVSAGYDGHWRDPLGGLTLTGAGYAHLTGHVQALADTYCQGKMALTLEGGYDLTALTGAVEATLRVLAGDSPDTASQPDEAGPGPGGYSPEVSLLQDIFHEARQLHKL